MSIVPKSRRDQHDFIANHNLREIRKRVTELVINNFRYDKEWMEKRIIAYEDIEQAYKSWLGDFTRPMSKRQIQNMKQIYKELFGKEPRWKKQTSQG